MENRAEPNAAEKPTSEPTKHQTLAFGFGALTDQMSHESFQFLVFTFYYAVVGVNVNVIAIAFIIFAIWDSLNDPLLGPISDRTHTRWGRRRFWILIITTPLAIVQFLLFVPPISDVNASAIYMFVIIMVYDFFYTIFSTNQTSMFPEMFKTEQKRSQANMYKNILTIVGVLVGIVMPTALITPMAASATTPPDVAAKIPGMYILTGLILAILIVVFGFSFYKYGMKEDPAHLVAAQGIPPIIESLKRTLKNKTFIIFVIANLFVWFVFKLLTTIVPLYGINVLGIKEGSILLSILLLVAFLSAAAFFPVCRKLGLKMGMRNAFILTNIIWIVAFIPFWFLDNQPYLAIVCMIFVGIGLAGAMYYVDIIISSCIDENEVKEGCRREGAFYGVNALINRYSTILVFVVIAATLSGYGWSNYIVNTGLDLTGLQTALKLLMVVFPIIGLVVTILFLKWFPLHGAKWQQVQDQLKEIRERRACEPEEAK
ncbi:MAG TPA: MFS transporter [Candidatus Lokiarchaeia archaeon]|nr:MFS transporter [Candidatus Lokiarchaeia archaeon]